MIIKHVKNMTIEEKRIKVHELIWRYQALAYTNIYIIGFQYKGIIYVYVAYDLGDGIVLNESSNKNGAAYSLRYRPTKELKEHLIKTGIAKPWIPVEQLESLVTSTKRNRGEVFERLVVEAMGQVWHKDKTPFNEGPDVTYNGVDYQIKYEDATITNEFTLSNIERAAIQLLDQKSIIASQDGGEEIIMTIKTFDIYNGRRYCYHNTYDITDIIWEAITYQDPIYIEDLTFYEKEQIQEYLIQEGKEPITHDLYNKWIVYDINKRKFRKIKPNTDLYKDFNTRYSGDLKLIDVIVNALEVTETE